MRLVILNPHVNQCGKMVYNWLFKSPQHLKYAYLWDEALKNNDREISFLVDGIQSSFYQTAYFEKTIARIPFLLRLFTAVEFWVWKRINKIPSGRFSVFTNHKKLDSQKDIIFLFGFTSFKSDLHDYNGIVLVHLSHYHLHTKEIANFVRSLKNGFVVSEGDIEKNDYFQHYFPDIMGRTYQLPFTFSPDRFKIVTSFDKRITKCFASGPMSVPSENSYTEYYGKDIALNPMREKLYEHRKEISDVVAAYIYPHDYAIKGMKEVQQRDSFTTQIAKKYFPAWVLTSVLHYKLPYYSFDIVQKYNEYTMFSSPEERTGLPSMKLLEGILCGAVLVGIDDTMYSKIGFKDGVNYVAYNNNLEDLKRKIIYYQNHQDELKKIAIAGFDFITSHFTPEKVFEIFWRDLEKLSALANTGHAKFDCSFVKE